MKKKTVNNIAKKLFIGSILSVVLLLSAQDKAAAAVSLKNDSTINASKSDKVLVKYMGYSEDGLYFNVKYNNEKGKDFDVVIKDENGETLYEGSFNDKAFDKKFLLPKDYEVSFISIAVQSGRENFVQSYNVTVKSSTIKDVVVSKN